MSLTNRMTHRTKSLFGDVRAVAPVPLQARDSPAEGWAAGSFDEPNNGKVLSRRRANDLLRFPSIESSVDETSNISKLDGLLASLASSPRKYTACMNQGQSMKK